jgi:hypothetical protein
MRKKKSFSKETLAENKQGKTRAVLCLIDTVLLFVASIFSSKH